MIKLRKKIFWTLWVILSGFLLSMTLIFWYHDYNRDQTLVLQSLTRMSKNLNEIIWNGSGFLRIGSIDLSDDTLSEEELKKFMDAKIYTILLNRDNQIFAMISHTEDGEVDSAVTEAAARIVNTKEQSTLRVGNLYFSDFSYKYERGRYIVLFDNRVLREQLLVSLYAMMLLCLIAEIIIIIAARLLSEWLIRPVENTFNKQKQFIADASHELKTPLAIIMTCAETLEDNPGETKRLRDIRHESERMNKLITNLLDLAKVEDMQRPELYHELDFSQLVKKRVLTFESLAFEKNLELQLQVENAIKLNGNREELNELVGILLDNAIAHGDVHSMITIRLCREKNRINLEVTNQGRPIPKGEETKIFERFYRGDKSRNRQTNHYGLGLAIAKGIVENHEGKISAFSKNGLTTFRVIFGKSHTLLPRKLQ